jgi:hypothetical protein
MEVLDVVGESCDEAPDRATVKKGQVEPHEMREQALSQAVHGTLSGPFEHHDLEEVGDKANQNHGQEGTGKRSD